MSETSKLIVEAHRSAATIYASGDLTTAAVRRAVEAAIDAVVLQHTRGQRGAVGAAAADDPQLARDCRAICRCLVATLPASTSLSTT